MHVIWHEHDRPNVYAYYYYNILHYTIIPNICLFLKPHRLMVSVHRAANTTVERVLDPLSGETNDYKIWYLLF
jgi:hypothetical protein